MSAMRDILVTGLMFFLPEAAHASCVAVAPSAVPTVSYDPFSQAIAGTIFSIDVNTSNCPDGSNPGGQIWFSDDAGLVPARLELGGMVLSLSYAGIELLSLGGSAQEPGGNSIQSAQSGAQSFQVSIALPRTGSGGVRSESREFSIYYRFEDDRIVRRLPLQLALKLAPSFEIVANGSGQGTLDLGELAAGATGSLLVNARGTDKFRIEMQSQHGQTLRRVEGCGVPATGTDPLETIDYTATLGGAPISIATPFVDISPRGEELFEKTLPLTVSISPGFKPEQKRAGRYCDVIRLTISPL